MEGFFPDEVTIHDARRWLSEAHADMLLVGHTHIGFALRVFGGGLVANPGALLRDGDVDERSLVEQETDAIVPGPTHLGGTFAVLELPARRFSVHRAANGEEIEIPRATLGIWSR